MFILKRRSLSDANFPTKPGFYSVLVGDRLVLGVAMTAFYNMHLSG